MVDSDSAGGFLPPGLQLSSGGVISGIPTTVGMYSFQVYVTDSESTPVTTQPATFTINISPCAPTILTTSPLPGGEVGIPYTEQIQISGCSGSTYTFAPGSALPPGFNNPGLATNGVLSGTPTKAGTYSIIVFVTDTTSGMVAANPTFSLTITPPPTFSTASPLPAGIVSVLIRKKSL